jgi:hypothetical protein
MPDKFDTFSKLKPDRTANDSTPASIDTEPTSEERYNRFQQSVDRAEQRFNPVEEPKVPTESESKSLWNKGDVKSKSGDDFSSSAWNG